MLWVTLPKHVREAAGIRPGDTVEVRATASGAVVIEKAEPADDYGARLHALAQRRLIRGISTDELLTMTVAIPDSTRRTASDASESERRRLRNSTQRPR